MRHIETVRGRFSILLVCTGNICRSCVAERLLASSLPVTVKVSSAGTHALVGQPIAQPLLPLLQLAGANADGFVSRQLTERLARDADLILTMTREHRAAVLEMWPGAVRRLFTLREFARLLSEVDSGRIGEPDVASRLRAALPLAAAQRRQVNQPAELDDVADPYRRPSEEYHRAFTEIQQAVMVIVEAVQPDRGVGGDRLTAAEAELLSGFGAGRPDNVNL